LADPLRAVEVPFFEVDVDQQREQRPGRPAATGRPGPGRQAAGHGGGARAELVEAADSTAPLPKT
jgi:hypothetical protein